MSTRGKRAVKKGPGRNSINNPEPSTSKKDDKDKESSDEEVLDDEQEGGTRLGGVYIPPAPPAICSTENTGPRLIITHIVNENFKSYAGKQILGPFHKSFTSIIGPNGSGKSNVIDSMLFVFGYRATKIRSKKISVLLHKSENHQNIKSCTVAVHFVQINDLEGEQFEVRKNTELVVARTAFADNSSFYTINGRRAQFKDVATLLRSHGIDLVHNRFLILQGEVETIAMMKPKAQTEHDTGMLEYLEDIIGTSRYKVPIEKLAEKLVQVSEERQEKVTRLKNAEKDRDSLKGPMLDAVEFLKTENKKSLTSNKMYQRQIYDSEKELEKAEEVKKKFDESMSEIKGKLKTIQEERSTKEKDLNAKRKELETVKTQKDKLNEAFQDVENKSLQLKERVTLTNKQRKKAQENKKTEETKLAELEKVPENNKKEIEELTVVQEKLKRDIAKEETAVEKVLASLRLETQELQESKDKLSNKLLDLNNKRDNAKSNYEIAKSEIDIYLSNQQKESTKFEQMKTNLVKTKDRIKELSGKTEWLEKRVPDADRELKEGTAELESIRKEDSVVNLELNRARASLEDMRSTAHASQTHNQILQFIMNLKLSGKIPGIYGRLGDLGGIDQKYDVAVSTACGFLDHIVVDTVDTGRDCLEELKKHNVGRANFLAVDKQEKFRSHYSKPFHAPENVPRLFDLITVEDDRVRPAFYFALRDTCVANDLSQAKRVAYGSTRYRVVTLSGEIIEISGTMSGGGNHITRGRMGTSAVKVAVASPGKVQGAERKVTELRARAQTLRERQGILEESNSNLIRDLRKWNMELNSFRVELRGLKEQVPTLEQQLKVQEKAVKDAAPDPNDLKEKEIAVKTLKGTFDKASKISGELEAEVNEISEKIEAATGGRMKAAQKKLDTVTKQHDKVVAEITKLKVAITSSARNVKKTRDRIQVLTGDIKDFEMTLKTAEAELVKLRTEGSWVNDKIEKLTEEILSKEEATGNLRQSINDLVKEENKIKAHKLNEDQKVESMLKKIQDLKSSIPSLKRKLNALKLHEIPDEDGDMIVEELPVLTEEEILEVDATQLSYKMTRYDEQLKSMKPNLNAIQDYKEKAALFKGRCQELDDVTKRRNEIRKAHDDVRKLRLTEFMAGFTVISSKLKEMYQMITLGGDAEFELMDSLDPFSEGVVFSVRPPKKSWKNISNLSGGEKTLSSLALVFALHYYRPSPLYVMDEIDAALDFKNVSIVGNYIKERTRNAQFIIISLRSNMFELADLLVGIFKTHNCTKSVTITPGEYVRVPENGTAENDNDDGPPAKISRKS